MAQSLINGQSQQHVKERVQAAFVYVCIPMFRAFVETDSFNHVSINDEVSRYRLCRSLLLVNVIEMLAEHYWLPRRKRN